MSTLKVIYPNSFPMVNDECKLRHESKWCMMPGLAVEIINLIANHMNITIEPIHYNDPALRIDQIC
jgi:hypothetical protein